MGRSTTGGLEMLTLVVEGKEPRTLTTPDEVFAALKCPQCDGRFSTGNYDTTLYESGNIGFYHSWCGTYWKIEHA